MEKTEKVLCFAEYFKVIFEKLKSTIFNFIELSPSLEEIENANEILCKQNFRVIEVYNIIKSYFETLLIFKASLSKVRKSKKR